MSLWSWMDGFVQFYLLYVVQADVTLSCLSGFRPGVRRGSSRDSGEKGQWLRTLSYPHFFV